jgi:Ni,Fe-hydrogenase III small subunit/ferredoxin
MLQTLLARLQQGHRTISYPADAPSLPSRFRGLPVLNASACPDGCRVCAESCPTHAISTDGGSARLDLGRCLFCTDCMDACPEGVIDYSHDYRLAARTREDLHVGENERKLATSLDETTRRLFGRSLKLRQVSAGGCNACEADLNVLGTVVFDLGRFGVQFVASPRHADGIVVTGPVSENMRMALLETYAAVPAPKLVIAVGACAISGGPYIDNPEVNNGCGALVPVDLYIPGCPPHPLTTLDGLLRLLGRVEESAGA